MANEICFVRILLTCRLDWLWLFHFIHSMATGKGSGNHSFVPFSRSPQFWRQKLLKLNNWLRKLCETAPRVSCLGSHGITLQSIMWLPQLRAGVDTRCRCESLQELVCIRTCARSNTKSFICAKILLSEVNHKVDIQELYWEKKFTHVKMKNKISPPAWTQEAYRPPCSEYSPSQVVLPVVPPLGGVPDLGSTPGGYLTREPPLGWPDPGNPPRGGVPDPGTPPGGSPDPGTPLGGYLTRVPPRGGTWQRVPPGGYLTRVPPWGYLTWVPPQGGYLTRVPPLGGDLTRVPPWGGYTDPGTPHGGGYLTGLPPPHR